MHLFPKVFIDLFSLILSFPFLPIQLNLLLPSGCPLFRNGQLHLLLGCLLTHFRSFFLILWCFIIVRLFHFFHRSCSHKATALHQILQLLYRGNMTLRSTAKLHSMLLSRNQLSLALLRGNLCILILKLLWMRQAVIIAPQKQFQIP